MNKRQEILKAVGVDLSTASQLGKEIACYRIPGGTAAVEIWHSLRRQIADLQAWPLLCGGQDENDYLQQAMGADIETPGVEDLFAIPKAPPLEALKESRKKQHEAMKRYLAQPEIQEISFEDDEEEPHHDETPNYADWPMQPPHSRRVPMSVFEMASNRPRRDCLLAIVPTVDPSQVPLHMRFGGWNACPKPGLHAAFFADWQRRFGAAPIVITHDVVEMYVERPPQTPQEAFALAREQYEYCNDIVDQGTDTIEALAQEIWQAPYWYFWWD